MTTPTTKWIFVPSHDSSLTGNAIPDSWEDEDGNRVWENPTPTTTDGMGDEVKLTGEPGLMCNTNAGEIHAFPATLNGEKSVAVNMKAKAGYKTSFGLSEEGASGLAQLLFKMIGFDVTFLQSERDALTVERDTFQQAVKSQYSRLREIERLIGCTSEGDTIELMIGQLKAERDTAQAQCAGLRDLLQSSLSLIPHAPICGKICYCLHGKIAIALATDPGNAIHPKTRP